jgi:hypothetical protein
MNASRPTPNRNADEGFRLSVWRAYGASRGEASELLAYAASPLHEELPSAHVYPLPDPPCVAAWEGYAAEAAESGALGVLRRVFVQLRFPICPGMSEDEAYRGATRRGVHEGGDGDGVRFVEPDGLRILLHPTAAGRVPAIVAEARADFESLVQAITHRNEPSPVPASMGACLVAGYNNWDRVAALHRDFALRHPDDRTGEGWATAFRDLLPRKELYQDRFILLSAGPYSATPAEAIGLSADKWRSVSVRLRLEHECTHYVTRQAFGTMRKSLLDELVADYLGIVEAFGTFRAASFLRFMGLEAFPRYREGGRLQNYRGSPPLSDGSFSVLQPVVRRAAETLERLDLCARWRPMAAAEKGRVIFALTRVGLEGLASVEAKDRVEMALDEAAVPEPT